MNTPSHAIINLAILGKHQPSPATIPIVIGAILPDLPIFIFYFWAKFFLRLPEKQIWSEAYYQPFWQNITATFHSLPLAVMGVAVAHYCGWPAVKQICLSAILHSLCDLPLHNDDAHRHFFPFSNYRFISPVSYWDPRHNGAIGALIELSAVLAATVPVLGLINAWAGRGIVIVIDLVYLIGYLNFYGRAIWGVLKMSGQ